MVVASLLLSIPLDALLVFDGVPYAIVANVGLTETVIGQHDSKAETRMNGIERLRFQTFVKTYFKTTHLIYLV